MASPARPLREIKVIWTTKVREIYEEFPRDERAPVDRVLQNLEAGTIVPNRDRFMNMRSFDPLYRELWGVKGFHARLYGMFRKDAFVVVHAAWKNDENRNRTANTLNTALARLKEYDAGDPAVSFVRARTPLAPPTPQLVQPLTLVRPPTPQQARLKAVEGREYVWACVEKRDLVVPGSPLSYNYARDPRIHNVLVVGEMESYISAKVKALPVEQKIAMGLLDDNPMLPTLGALWAAEFFVTRELEQPVVQKSEAVEQLSEFELDLLTMPEQPAEIEQPVELPKEHNVFWYSHGRRKYLLQRVGDVKVRRSPHSDVKVPKVWARIYKRKLRKWTEPRIRLATDLQTPAPVSDPIVREALREA